jgi:hypothetical protein
MVPEPGSRLIADRNGLGISVVGTLSLPRTLSPLRTLSLNSALFTLHSVSAK